LKQKTNIMNSQAFINQVEQLVNLLLSTPQTVKISNLIKFPVSSYGITTESKPKRFNLAKLGWTFEWNHLEETPGQCRRDNKVIYISKFVVERADENLDFWRRIILHEMAHAIDVETRGYSDHGNIWEDICIQLGGIASSKVELKWHKDSLIYEIYCEDCGETQLTPYVPQSLTAWWGGATCVFCDGKINYRKRN
jgi:predicted SprT family Zn-dependent metalloprotease